MKPIHIIGGLFLLAATSIGAAVMAEDTTHVQNSGNDATVTQSGNPANTRKSVDSTPGHTRIEQRNGSNSAVITQDTGGGAAPINPDADDDDTMPVPTAKPRADGTGRPDVYGAVRERASPQGRANLDSLMNNLGLAGKTR